MFPKKHVFLAVREVSWSCDGEQPRHVPLLRAPWGPSALVHACRYKTASGREHGLLNFCYKFVRRQDVCE